MLSSEVACRPRRLRPTTADCTLDRGPCCVVADFHQPPLEIVDRVEVKARLAHYPDQSLVSHLLLGARTDADVKTRMATPSAYPRMSTVWSSGSASTAVAV